MAFDPVWFYRAPSSNTPIDSPKWVEPQQKGSIGKTSLVADWIFNEQLFDGLSSSFKEVLLNKNFMRILASFDLDDAYYFYYSCGIDPSLVDQDPLIKKKEIEEFKKEHSLDRVDEVLQQAVKVGNYAVYAMAKESLFEKLERKEEESPEFCKFAILEQIVSPIEREKYQSVENQKELMGRALSLAIENGNFFVVEELIKKVAISEERFQNFLLIVLSKGYINIFDILTSHYEISAVSRVLALCESAVRGHKEIVQRLLQDATIYDSMRGKAVMSAAETGQKEIIEILLNNGEIPVGERGLAVMSAVRNGSKDCVILLLENGLINDECRGEAAKIAVQRRDLAILSLILENGEIPMTHRIDAITQSAKFGHFAIFSKLIEGREIENHILGSSLKEAATLGHLEITKFCVKNSSISDYEKYIIMVAAVQNGHLEVVRELFTNWSFEQRKRGIFLCYATEYKHLEIVKLILKKGSISKERLEECIHLAARVRSREIAEILIEKKKAEPCILM
jgi:ankyrin repeat protein